MTTIQFIDFYNIPYIFVNDEIGLKALTTRHIGRYACLDEEKDRKGYFYVKSDILYIDFLGILSGKNMNGSIYEL